MALVNLTEPPNICNLSQSYQGALEIISFITYRIVPIFYFLFGMTGHLIALIVFVKNTNQMTAYRYQTLVSVTRIFEIVATCCFILFFVVGAGQDWGGGQEKTVRENWFTTNYGLMWISAHVTPMMERSFVTIVVFVVAAMSFDRAFALYSPLRYRSGDRRKRAIIAAVLCYGFGFLVCFHYSNWFLVVEKGGVYVLYANERLYESTTEKLLVLINSTARILAQMAIIGASIIMVKCVKKKNKVTMVWDQNKEREQAMVAEERALFRLAMCQCVVTLVPGMIQSTWSVGIMIWQDSFYCNRVMIATIIDLAQQIAGTMDFYCMLMISESFREKVKKVMGRQVEQTEIYPTGQF